VALFLYGGENFSLMPSRARRRRRTGGETDPDGIRDRMVGTSWSSGRGESKPFAVRSSSDRRGPSIPATRGLGLLVLRRPYRPRLGRSVPGEAAMEQVGGKESDREKRKAHAHYALPRRAGWMSRPFLS
jgi:hypothetical protein